MGLLWAAVVIEGIVIVVLYLALDQALRDLGSGVRTIARLHDDLSALVGDINYRVDSLERERPRRY